MPLQKVDSLSRNVLIVALVVGVIALILVSVGIGTPKWESTYASNGAGSTVLTGTANFFYTCSFRNGTFNNCTDRSSKLTGYPRYAASSSSLMRDYELRMQNAAGLSVVGILFLAFGLVATVLLMFLPMYAWINLISPILIFVACLFMTAGMAEGARYLLFNDYSANLYQAGHVLSMLCLFLSAFAVGRVHYFRKREEEAQVKPTSTT